jgi:predicted nucleic acid-binding protein
MNKEKKIMKKETMYIDTSVISAYYDDRAKDRQETTTKFWTQILPNYKAYISEITVEELEHTKDEALRNRLLKAVMVKVKTRRLVRLVNALKAFKEIEIVSPPEL